MTAETVGADVAAGLSEALALADRDSWSLPSGNSVVGMERLAEIVAHIIAQQRTADREHVGGSGRPSNERDGACICDYDPETTEGPVEHCPFHGRPYSYWVERADRTTADHAAALRAADAAGYIRGYGKGCESAAAVLTAVRALTEELCAVAGKSIATSLVAARSEAGA